MWCWVKVVYFSRVVIGVFRVFLVGGGMEVSRFEGVYLILVGLVREFRYFCGFVLRSRVFR